jgi:sugar diacid utilization regulator
MGVSCRELLELSSLQRLKLVGGSGGLDRYVRWVHFLDLPDVLPWVQGGELLFITGIGLNEGEDELLNLVKDIAKKKLAGLVINIGPYISVVPDAVITLADELNFPVFELPWEVKMVSVTQDVSRYIVMKQTEEKSINDLLENILFNTVCDFPTIIRRAAYYGHDLSQPHQVGVVRACDFENLFQEQQDELALMKFKERFEATVREILNQHYNKVLFITRVDNIVFLIPEVIYKNRNKLDNMVIVQEIIKNCQLKLPKIQLNIGLGNCFVDLEYAKISFDQALLALKFADFIKEQNKVYRYQDLGVYKLLFELDEAILESYYQETLGGLDDYDKKHGTELVTTLQIYLQENGNSIQAAKKLFIHKNTLIYRLKKLEAITGKNVDKMHDRITFQIGLIIGKQIVT